MHVEPFSDDSSMRQNHTAFTETLPTLMISLVGIELATKLLTSVATQLGQSLSQSRGRANQNIELMTYLTERAITWIGLGWVHFKKLVC
jgi:hypothetical protein